MANDFLETQKEIGNLQRYKSDLEARLAQADNEVTGPLKQQQQQQQQQLRAVDRCISQMNARQEVDRCQSKKRSE